MFDSRSALAVLRGWLQHLNIENATWYRTHDIRRGHARDLQAAGAPLSEILKAGEWRSATFMNYLDMVDLECDATLQAHLDESSDEESERL